MIPPRSVPTIAISLATLMFLGWMFSARPLNPPIYASPAPIAAMAPR